MELRRDFTSSNRYLIAANGLKPQLTYCSDSKQSDNFLPNLELRLFFPAFALSVGSATTNKLTHALDHNGNCALGVDLEISSSSGVMSAGTLANRGVLK
jgi:hypothetical protein